MHLSNLWCFTKEAMAAMRRRKLIALATLSTAFVSLLVLSTTIAGIANLSLISQKLRASGEVTVFVRKETSVSQVKSFEAWLTSRPQVDAVDYVSPETALSELASQLGQDARLLEAADSNPIPPSFRVRVREPELAPNLASVLRSRPEVFRVVYAAQATARLAAASRLLNVAGVALSLLLGVAAITIIHNAMAVAIDSRRKDIRIMHLVGADPRLIRLPYLISGVVYGLGGGLAASLVTIAGYALVVGAVKDALPFLPTAGVSRVATLTFPLTLGFGAAFGFAGASLSLSRHLQPHRAKVAPTRDAQPAGGGRVAKAVLAALVLVLILLSTAAVRADAGLSEKIARAKQLGSSIAVDTHRLAVLGARLKSSKARAAALDRRMRVLQDHIAVVTTKKRAVSGKLSKQLFAYYAASRNAHLEILAGSNSPQEAAVASERLGFVLRGEYEVFDEARSTLNDLSSSAVALQRLRVRAAATVRHIARASKELARRTAQRRSALRELVAGIRESLGVYGTSLTGAGDIAIYGTDGFIFPVAARHSFSNSWHAPRSGGRLHQGTDIMARQDAPLLSVVGGTVRLSSNKLGGTVIHLNGSDGTMYYYAHLSGYAPGLSSGQEVGPGQLVGFVGATGNAAGGAPHLHFEIHPGGGAAVNPYPKLVDADKLLFRP